MLRLNYSEKYNHKTGPGMFRINHPPIQENTGNDLCSSGFFRGVFYSYSGFYPAGDIAILVR